MLEVENLAVRYDGAIAALDGVDFAAARGSIVVLLGPNGAGKTTLLKAIAGMLPFERGEIVRGRVTIDGVLLNNRHPAAITRRGIALVQDGRQCFRSLTVAENLRAAACMRPGGRAQRLELVHRYFPALAEMRARPAGYLSGGQLQMLVLGMALMLQPEVLMLDEPSLGLSPVMVESVFDVVARLHHELGMVVVIAEQTVTRLLPLATDVYVLSRGKVALRTKPSGIDEDVLQRAYLS
jgi:branched-chain amino acid transport system ATP-binding protein